MLEETDKERTYRIMQEYNKKLEVEKQARVEKKKAYRQRPEVKARAAETARKYAKTEAGKANIDKAKQKHKMKKFEAYLKAEGLTYEEYKEKRLKELEVLKDF